MNPSVTSFRLLTSLCGELGENAVQERGLAGTFGADDQGDRDLFHLKFFVNDYLNLSSLMPLFFNFIFGLSDSEEGETSSKL